MSSKQCYFFIDNSNVWIEAQKFAASGNINTIPMLKETSQDPRARIDIVKLAEILRRDRIRGPSFIYGSQPPANDSYWKICKQNNFETNIYNRGYNNKEKEVDGSMMVAMSGKAKDLHYEAKFGGPDDKERKENAVFVVITGDRDMLPAIKQIVNECGIRIELWAWESNMSFEYSKMASEQELLSVKFLDRIFEDICFIEFFSKRWDEGINEDTTIVLCDVDSGDTGFICNQLRHTGLVFRITPSEGQSSDLFVDFAPPEGMVREREQFRRIIAEAKSLLPDITIMSWFDYNYKFLAQREVSINEGTTTGSNLAMYKNTDPGAVSPTTEIMDPSPQRSPSPRFNRPDTREGADRTHRNSFGTRLSERPRRASSHMYDLSNSTGSSFQRPTRNLDNMKTKLCRNGPDCERGAQCWFAHFEPEARCTICWKTGHFRDYPSKCGSRR